jgi:predicted nucleic acid-binding protein
VQRLDHALDRWALGVGEPMPIASPDVEQATQFVRRPELALRAPDAIHIAAAHRLGATLLTLDKGMARAAAALGVPYLNPAEAEAPGEPKD